VRIVLAGGTGLVGAKLATRLLEDESVEIHAILRRASGRSHSRWNEHVAPSVDWPAIVGAIGAETAISALGTTRRKAGSEAAFRAVDLDLVVAFADAARTAGADRFVALSSVGANPHSANFYLRTKGEMEAAVAALPFERVDIFRPGLLRGKREGDRRPGERIAILLSPALNLLLKGPLEPFAAVDAELVAAAIAASLHDQRPGLHRHDNRAIRRLARH
jgi:uncharacterized protein YbjT (DUF2867 family)